MPWPLQVLADHQTARVRLLAMADDPRAESRRVAVEMLGWLGDGAASPTIVAALRHDPSPAVRLAAARALVDIPSECATDALEAAVMDVDASVRELSAWILGARVTTSIPRRAATPVMAWGPPATLEAEERHARVR